MPFWMNCINACFRWILTEIVNYKGNIHIAYYCSHMIFSDFLLWTSANSINFIGAFVLKPFADNQPYGAPVGTWKHTGVPQEGGGGLISRYHVAVAPLDFFTQNFGVRGLYSQNEALKMYPVSFLNQLPNKRKNTIGDGGSTALCNANTVYTAQTALHCF